MVARNARCPCGSGRKHKLCCGMTRAEERELVRQAAVAAEIAQLPLEFPRLRPAGHAFAAWADAVAAGELDDPTIDEGIALLERKERNRIECAHGREFPTVWRSFCADLGGDEELARGTVVAGAVLAAVGERTPPDAEVLALVEESADLREDRCETLALVLEAGDLWSIYESIQVDEALAKLPDELDDAAYEAEWNAVLAAEAERLRTRWHERRLELLVDRLRGRLPLGGSPASSAALGAACGDFERDDAFRRRLAELLLADSLARVSLDIPLAA